MKLFGRRKEERAERILNMSELLSAGGAVSRKTALEVPTVAACVQKVADTVARLPIKLYRADGGEVTEIEKDRRITLLNGETGDTLNAADMWRAAIEDYYLGSGAWIYINSDGLNVKSLHYVDCEKVQLFENNDPIFKNFRISVNGVDYYDFQFVRILRKTKDGYTNIPVQHDTGGIIQAAYNTIVLQRDTTRTGGNKKGFFKAKTKLSDEAIKSVKNSYNALYGENSRSIALLNDGVEFQELSATAVEMQLNENKKSDANEISKLFGFPVSVIGGGATENDKKEFVSAVVAVLNQVETALDMALLTEKEKKDGYYWAFDTEELTRGSVKERFEAYEIAVRNNILQIDEIRKKEDFAPLGFNFVTLGLGDVLLDMAKKTIYTPNTNTFANIGGDSGEN